MLLQRISDNRDLFGSLKDMQKLQQQLNRLLSLTEAAPEFPLVDVWLSENGAIVRAEIPGLEADDVDISLLNDTLTIKGTRVREAAQEGNTCYRQERGFGQFSRSLQLPFGVERDAVEAKFINGVLEITLPRAEAEKARKIAIKGE